MIIKNLYIILVSGYIIEYISIGLKFIYYLIIVIYDYTSRCGCNCQKCKVKDCLNCEYTSCKSYNKFHGKDCLCRCEECLIDRCNFCQKGCVCCLEYFCCGYCKFNKEMKTVERCLGFIVDLVTIILVLYCIIMMTSPEGLDEITNMSSNLETAPFEEE